MSIENQYARAFIKAFRGLAARHLRVARLLYDVTDSMYASGDARILEAREILIEAERWYNSLEPATPDPVHDLGGALSDTVQDAEEKKEKRS